MNQVKWVDQVPNWKGLTAKDVWHSVRQDGKFIPYFPDYKEKQTP